MNLSIYHKQLQRAKERFFSGNDFLLQLIGNELIERISLTQKNYGNILSLFALTDFLPKQLTQLTANKNITRIEHPIYLGEKPDKIIYDNNLQLQNNYYDLIITPYLHDHNLLPQIYNGLQNNGLFIAANFGPNTLRELKHSLISSTSEITGGTANHFDNLFSMQQWGELLQQNNFQQIIIDKKLLTIHYVSVEKLIADLRGMGASNKNINHKYKLTKKIYQRMLDIYHQQFFDNKKNKFIATFEIIFFSGKK